MTIRAQQLAWVATCMLPAAFFWFATYVWVRSCETMSADANSGLLVIVLTVYLVAVACLYGFPGLRLRGRPRHSAIWGLGVVGLCAWLAGGWLLGCALAS